MFWHAQDFECGQAGIAWIGFAASPGAAARAFDLDDRDPGGAQCPREPDPVASGAFEPHYDSWARCMFGGPGQRTGESRGVVGDRQCRECRAVRCGHLQCVGVALGVAPSGAWVRGGTGPGRTTRRHICDGSRAVRHGQACRSGQQAERAGADARNDRSFARHTQTGGHITRESVPGIGTDPDSDSLSNRYDTLTDHAVAAPRLRRTRRPRYTTMRDSTPPLRPRLHLGRDSACPAVARRQERWHRRTASMERPREHGQSRPSAKPWTTGSVPRRHRNMIGDCRRATVVHPPDRYPLDISVMRLELLVDNIPQMWSFPLSRTRAAARRRLLYVQSA
ncbi:hypothetical protein Rruber_05434 (plasmid) [Rhodococcus ruber]